MYIQIKNKKFEADFCKGISKVIGFMFSKPRKAKVLVFNREERVSLHMVFVFFPILALFVNKGRIVEIKKLMPFTFYTSKKKAKYVVEIPIKNIKVKVGQKIKFIS